MQLCSQKFLFGLSVNSKSSRPPIRITAKPLILYLIEDDIPLHLFTSSVVGGHLLLNFLRIFFVFPSYKNLHILCVVFVSLLHSL